MNNINWNKVLWRAAQFIFIAILNTSLWFFLIANMIEVGDGEATYWDALTVKYVNKQLDLDLYHWYNKVLVYLGILIGLGLSVSFIKWLYMVNLKKKEIDYYKDKEQKLKDKHLKKVKNIWEE